jgi:hypothetical protein
MLIGNMIGMPFSSGKGKSEPSIPMNSEHLTVGINASVDYVTITYRPAYPEEHLTVGINALLAYSEAV